MLSCSPRFDQVWSWFIAYSIEETITRADAGPEKNTRSYFFLGERLLPKSILVKFDNLKI